MTDGRRDPRIEARRLSFDARADEYRAARPPYPSELFDLLADRHGLRPGARVLEIGPGTGQATGELLARGAVVTAVEPGARMAAYLTAYLAADLTAGRLTVHVDRIETVPLPPAQFDLVVSATAFHWVDAAMALPRLARALRPGGRLAVWWTAFGDPSRPTPFRDGIAALYARNFPTDLPPVGGSPLDVDSWCDQLAAGGHFTRPEVTHVRWDHELTPEGAVRLFGSFPNVNELAPAKRAAHLEAIAELVRRHGGVVADPYDTVLYVCAPKRSALSIVD